MARTLPILAIEPGSAAARAGLRVGERLRSMNGAPLRDVIDLRFEGAEPEIVAEVEDAAGNVRSVLIERQPGQALGIETAEMQARTCANDCVFCFIDQMPAGRRGGLYVRDEDFRFSFLHGNYVTLTNTRPQDIARIIEQGLSPLYVSVHATDPEVRARLLGIPVAKGADVMPKLRELIDGGIRVHGQVVLCPGWNDGPALDETLRTLAGLHPGVQSVAVVPLGLTRHRDGLPELEPVDGDDAHRIVEQCERLQAECQRRLGVPFAYLADEWYFLTGRPIPAAEHYHDFPLLEDGVGMTRRFVEHLREAGDTLPILDTVHDRTVTVVTGRMAAPVVEEHLAAGVLAPRARAVEVVPVDNHFMGTSITVSGLLVGGDILAALDGRAIGEVVLLPPNCVNGRALFLDDMPLDAFTARLGASVHVGLGDEAFATNPVWEKD